MYRLLMIACTIAVLTIAGCSSSNDPVNKDKDVPIHLKKDKEKDK